MILMGESITAGKAIRYLAVWILAAVLIIVVLSMAYLAVLPWFLTR
jgi:hypothetical protein